MSTSPLEKASAADLEPILEEEASHFSSVLSWDTQPGLNIILQHVRAQTLPGTILRTSGGTVSGYEYHVFDGPVGFIGGLYVRDRDASQEAYSRLINEALGALVKSGGVERIECQLFSFNVALAPLFEAKGFQLFRRHFLLRELADVSHQSADRLFPGVRIQKWQSSFFESVARVVYQSYRESADRRLCLDYQSSSGCYRFMRNLIGNPGCGRFNAETSLVATSAGDSVEGVLIASNISSENGMIPQLSVRPEFQRRGLGTRLIQEHFRLARGQGLRTVSLSVSEDNRDALRLYERLGFQRIKEFHAFVWERNPAAE